MDSPPKSLRSLFLTAERARRALDGLSVPSAADPIYQSALSQALQLYDQCARRAEEVSLFSRNETEDDVGSADMRYFVVDFYRGLLSLRLATKNAEERLEVVQRASSLFTTFLGRLEDYTMLANANAKLLRQYTQAAPENFATASSTDAAARRNTKIQRLRDEKRLQAVVAELEARQAQQSGADEEGDEEDETLVREVNRAHIDFCVHSAFNELEGIAQELVVLKMAPSADIQQANDQARREQEQETQQRRQDNDPTRFTDRLETVGNSANGSAILSKDGRPLRPFTIVGDRSRLRQGVFRPDHNLPTMSIDDYLAEERRRGGIIEGGGEASLQQPAVDEDDLDAADRETMEKRRWDEFTEANPKGMGNTMNMG